MKVAEGGVSALIEKWQEKQELFQVEYELPPMSLHVITSSRVWRLDLATDELHDLTLRRTPRVPQVSQTFVVSSADGANAAAAAAKTTASFPGS